ncbi:hypothetical protein PK28_02335 [Hymenobacter sp. DG25B]|nr:hypothetical protein PK28_02335 [Hymenobacter sp. DG25B]
MKLRNPHGLSLYSVTGSGNELAINGLPVLTSGAVVPLGLVIPQIGTYTLKVAKLLHLESTPVVLVDAVTGQETDLQTQAAYTFTTDSKAVSGRFALRFGPATATPTRAALLATAIALYPNPAHHTVTLALPSVPGTKTAQVAVFNALGQEVRQFELGLKPNGAEHKLELANLPAGVYSVHVQAGEVATTKRLVIE